MSTISFEEFNNSASNSWKLFYGSNSRDRPIPQSWYSSYRGKFRDPNTKNKDGSLETCIETLLWDQDSIAKSSNYSIPRLIDEFPEDFKGIEMDLQITPEVSANGTGGYEALMLNNKSSLQRALIQPPGRDVKSKSVPRPHEWSPSLCVFPFHAFEPHLNLCLKAQKTESSLAKCDVEILKLRYVEYLSLLISGKNQFILGVFTAYGPDVLQYPIRVLEILKRWELLRPDTKLFHAITPVKIEEDEDENGFEEIFEIHEDWEGDCDESEELEEYTEENQTESVNSSIANGSGTSISPPPELNRLASSMVSLTLSSSSATATASQVSWKGVKTIASDVFYCAVDECWKSFYGEETKRIMPTEWYHNFQSQFPNPNNKNGILDTCIQVILRDQDSLRRTSESFKIPGFKDQFREEFKKIRKCLTNSEPTLPFIPTSINGYEHLMLHGKSFLQKALVEPLLLDASADRTERSKSIPQRVDWCPSRCVYPFPAFQAHVHWSLRNTKHRNLDLELMKLRYIEYLAILQGKSNQFVRAICTAYGSYLLNCPVRVLQILKQRNLLRTGTELYDVLDGLPFDDCPYADIFGNPVLTQKGQSSQQNLIMEQASTILTTPTLNLVSPPTTESSSSVTVIAKVRDEKTVSTEKKQLSSGEINAKVKPVPNPFEVWKSACEKALDKLSTDPSIRFNIPDSYYDELFQSYSESVQSHTEQNIFNLFILAVWTGTRLNEFQVGPLASSSSEISTHETKVKSTNSNLPTSAATADHNSKLEFDDSPLVTFQPNAVVGVRLDAGADKLLQQFGITPQPNVQFIQETFLNGKRLELEALDMIEKEFKGDGLRNFVKEFSLRICWVTEEEDLKLSAMLIVGLLQKKLISKPFVIHSLKHGVVKHLPELSVKLLNVTYRTALFLFHLFMAEEDLCWFLSLTDDLRRKYLPVWIDLSRKMVAVIKDRNSVSGVMELFSKTPDSHELLCELES